MKKTSAATDKKTLRSAFNAAARQPALRFELQSGLDGIAGRYVFPEGFTAARYERYYTWLFSTPIKHPRIVIEKKMPDKAWMEQEPRPNGISNILPLTSDVYKAALLDGWLQLKALNPCLSAVRLDEGNAAEVYNALFGVTSGFNTDDINFFLHAVREGHQPAAWSCTMKDIRDMRHAAQEQTGAPLYWVASRETLQLIMRKIAARPPQP